MNRTRDKLLRIAIFALIGLFCLLLLLPIRYSEDARAEVLWESVVFRFLGSLIFGLLLLLLGYRVLAKPTVACLAAVLPALAVVVNNLPILALIQQTARVERTDLIPLLLLDCILIGIFEELAFRGVLFLMILEKRRESKRQIVLATVLSSAVFGLIHLANLFERAGVGATVLQVGYSFLIGGMCSIVLLRTGNLLFCILLHAVYDFCGRLLPVLGAGSWWDTPTVIWTAILAVAVTVWMVLMLFRTEPAMAGRFYSDTSKENLE